MPRVPKIARPATDRRASLGQRKGIFFFRSIINATRAATTFRKKDFCSVGISPDSLINRLINEKEKADRIIYRIPFVLFDIIIPRAYCGLRNCSVFEILPEHKKLLRYDNFDFCFFSIVGADGNYGRAFLYGGYFACVGYFGYGCF